MSRHHDYPSDWNQTTLGCLAEYINGRAFKPSEWASTGLPIIRIEQIKDTLANFDYFNGPVAHDHLVHDGDLLFSWSATLSTLIWDRGPAVLNQHIYKVVPKGNTDIRFLHHLLDFQIDALAGQTHGSTMKHIKRTDLLPFRVIVPPVDEQHQIAKILDSLDSAIQQTDSLIAKLKLMKAGLLHDLLTRGIDEIGELRDPVQHHEQFMRTTLRCIPNQWKLRPLGDVAEIGLGITLGRTISGPGTVEMPYLRVANVQDGFIDLTDVKTIRVRHEEVPRYLLQEGDV